MKWKLIYLPEARDDLKKLDGSQQIVVRKALEKLKSNPLPNTEGGYGKWLGNQTSTRLAGFLKVKLRKSGIRIVYKLIRQEGKVLVVIIGLRKDSEVYKLAQSRIDKISL